MKLAVFDFDSTLVKNETIDELASAYGVSDEVVKITYLSMNGELDFYESLKRRAALLKGMREADAIEVCHNLEFNKGAQDIVKWLKERGFMVVCFSGGFRIATSYYGALLRLDADFSNILHTKDGILSGEIGGEMMFGDSKGNMLLRLQHLLGVSVENTLVVGDGANDLSMFKYASKKVAFCAKDVLKKEANIIIDKHDLMLITHHL